MTGSTPTPPKGRAPRARWIVTAAAIAVVVIVVVAFAIAFLRPSPSTGPQTTVTREIDLLPSHGTPSHCITGVPGVPRPTYPLQDAVLQANTYDVPAGTTGAVGMCYDSTTGSMLGYANWSKVGPAGGWFSYPQVTYGVNFWYGPYTTYTNMSPSWELPETVSAVDNESVWYTASYQLNPPSSADVTGYDLSFDDFLMEQVPSYFEVGPFVEVEIFLAHDIGYPFQWINWTTPTLLNGEVSAVPWSIAYYCHGPTPDNGSNENVSFDFSLEGQSTHGVPAGEVGVNISAILAEVNALMPSVSCWEGPIHDFSSFHLDEVDLGSEDGAIGGASYSYNWTIEDDCIHANVTTATPDGVTC